jgi:small-conductance mechanosensitive channel/CRP-like cAMP-binding protein
MSASLPHLRILLLAGAIAIAVYLALVALAHLARRIRGVRFGWTYHAFAITAGVAAGLAAAPGSFPWRSAWLGHVVPALIVLASFPLVTLLNRLLWTRTLGDGTRADAPSLLADTTRLVVLVAVVLAVIQGFYGVQVPGLLAGSGVAAIILGLAMQDLLGNLLAGFALHIGKPFRTGDWLLVDGQHARVIELTWRATRLLTVDDVQLDVPNSDLVKRPVLNFARPTPRHAIRITVSLECTVPPERAAEILRQAAATVSGVCEEPPPRALVKEFADSSIVYEIKFWIDDHAQHARVASDVRTHCWYALRRAGLELPFPTLTLRRPAPAGDGALATATAATTLRGHELFGILSEEQVAALIAGSRLALFAPGEHLVDQDAPGSSMYLVTRGVVEVRLGRGGRFTVVSQLGPGDCVGEMSLLTGEPRSATCVARDEVEAFEVTRAAFGGIVRDSPELLRSLSELVARRQLANQQVAVGDVETAQRTATGVLERLRSFFELGA